MSRARRRPARRGAPIIVALAAGLATMSILPASAQQPLEPDRIDVVQAPGSLGPADAAARVDFDLVLADRDPAAFDRFRAALYDPASPDYRRFLTPQQIGERFGPTDATLDQVRAAVASADLTVVSVPPQRSRMSVSGTAAAASAFLGVTIERWQDPGSGLAYHATTGSPAVPAALADAVIAVEGLSPVLPASAVDPADAPPVPARGLTPPDLARAYDFQSLWDQGIDGTGTTVGILQFGVDTDEDLAVFDAAFGIEGPTPIRVPIDGGLEDAPAKFGTEAALDTQVVRAVAPGTQIIVYGFPATTSFGAAMDAIVTDGRTQLVSVSYGKCYAAGYVGLDEVLGTQEALKDAAAAGISLFAASGDWGAYSCHTFDNTDHRVSTFFPACTDNVVSVGGTLLELNADGTYKRETGWEDYLVTGGTGGGVASVNGPDGPLEQLPPYQQGYPGVEQSVTGRFCPDVAAVADGDTGYLLFETSQETGEPGWKMVGGTSGAAPFWAGVMALIQQKAQAEGVTQLGFLTPLFYQLAQSHPQAFHDIVRGGNLLHDAGPGWDAATGVGTPIVSVLADAVIETLQGGGG
ncbi:MAG: S53 family peptidase [Candidatus Limnocylindrales bacterium]